MFPVKTKLSHEAHFCCFVADYSLFFEEINSIIAKGAMPSKGIAPLI